MVEVEKLCKKILFIINLARIKQTTGDKCSSKGGGGCNPHNPSPGSTSGFVLILEEVTTETQVNDDETLRVRCTCRM